MAKTKAEIRAFLDSKVGTKVPHPGYPDLDGQCVTLTKALMEFLGVPNPYAARGDAINAGDTYIRQGLGTPGRGWLTVVVNKDMGYIGGVHHGHIWIDLLNEANYESNGARALYTTKNTRPVTQGQQFINFDQWVKGENMADFEVLQQMSHSILGRRVPVTREWYDNQSAEKNQELRTVVLNWTASDEAKAFRNKAWDYDRLAKEFADYKKANPVGGLTCTPDERAYLDALKKVTS